MKNLSRLSLVLLVLAVVAGCANTHKTGAAGATSDIVATAGATSPSAAVATAAADTAPVAADPSGAVKLVGDNVELQIQTPGGVRTLTAKDGEVQLPVGSYKPVAVRLVAAETLEENGVAKNVAWTLAGQAPWGALESVSVAEGKTTEVKAGAPLVVKADVQVADGTVTVGCAILGAASESYAPGAAKDGAAQPAPGIKILDSSGKVLDSGTLAYG